MADLRGLGRARSRIEVGDVCLQQGDVAARVTSNHGHRNLTAVREPDVEVLVPLDDVVGGDDQAVGAPDDAARRLPSPPMDGHRGCSGPLDRGREVVRQLDKHPHPNTFGGNVCSCITRVLGGYGSTGERGRDRRGGNAQPRGALHELAAIDRAAVQLLDEIIEMVVGRHPASP